MIAAGLAGYGFHAEAAKIFDGLFAASRYIDLRRLPELFCGFPRKPAQGPTFYPVACSPQAWAAAAPLSMIQSCIGLSFDPAAHQIILREPMLPTFLNDLVLRNVRGQGRLGRYRAAPLRPARRRRRAGPARAGQGGDDRLTAQRCCSLSQLSSRSTSAL